MSDETLRNTQPLYSGGNPSWPLTWCDPIEGPYCSRVEGDEIEFEGALDQDRAKNYQMVAFKPGHSLQASELNEIQEHFQMQLTLSISMMHNWITSGSTPIWNGWNKDTHGSEGGKEAFGWNTSIGQGGGWDGNNAFHDPALAITAPGWRGACPLHPYQNPYQGTPNSFSPVSVQFFPTNQRLVITFWPGWWLTEVRRWWNGDDEEQPQYVSGLKHWVYLDTTTAAEADPNFQRTIDLNQLGTDRTAIVGMVTNSDYVGCCQEEDSTDELPCDPTLFDNASGNPNSASAGAGRYKVWFTRANHTMSNEDGNWGDENADDSPFAEKESIAAVCKIDPVNRTVRYMNNLLIATY